jgi:hypothetical protein
MTGASSAVMYRLKIVFAVSVIASVIALLLIWQSRRDTALRKARADASAARREAIRIRNETVLIKIHHTRTLGPHLTMGYNKQSEVTLSKQLSPQDVQELLDLLLEEREPVGVQMALATQCGFALDGIQEAVQEGRFGSNRERSKLDLAREVISRIESSPLCSKKTHDDAQRMRTDLALLAPQQ